MTSRQMEARVAREMALSKRDFARRLRAARENAGLTQGQLADRIGRDWASVQRWETEKTSPRPGMIPRIARALDVSEEHLQGTLDSADTTLERLVRDIGTQSRAIRELHVAVDGLVAMLEQIRAAQMDLTILLTGDRQGDGWEADAADAMRRLSSGIGAQRGRVGQEAPPRSS